MLGILLRRHPHLSLQNVTPTEFTVAVMILALFALIFGFILMWILSCSHRHPVRVARAASIASRRRPGYQPCRVGRHRTRPVAAWFNSMVDGLRNANARDLFGRHVGRRSPHSPSRYGRSSVAKSAMPQ